MKQFKYIGIGVMSLMLLFSSGLYAQKKDELKKEEVAKLVAAHSYVFKALTMLPSATVPSRQLTSEYDVQVSKDTVVCFLPYFGRAYVAPMDPTKGGIQFTTTKFDYKETVRKKGGWDIIIKPEDNQDTRQLTLNVTETGYASLQVISNNKQPIFFSGYITAKKTKR